MNRNLTWLFCFVILSVAAFAGCGGGSDTPQTLVQPPVNEAGTDQDVAPDSDPPDGGQDVLPDNTGNDSDVFIPDAAETGDEGQTCTAKLCDPCPNEGETCGDYTCTQGSWIETGDSGPVSSPCFNPEAGTDADADSAAPQEICNGLDDNGNNLKDEGFSCIGGTSGSCWTTCGTQGTMNCGIPSCEWSACAPPAEDCNNFKDDDCDGKVDCADPDCASAPNCQCNPPNIGSDCAFAGEFSCSPQVRCNCNFLWDNAALPHFSCITIETCNGQDDNGNGQVDENFPCIQNAPGQCATACGSVGSRMCSSTCTWGACVPPAENCSNGLDDDCDDKVDCADPDCAGFIACKPEICDGVDNNGNGLKDDGFECVYGTTTPCTTSCNSLGYKTCSTTTCTWGACVPPAEICGNGKDDNCDGKADCADPACLGLPACNTVAEICNNGIDDNDNGLIDCADPACAGKTGCVELCNGLDDNNNGQTDETFECVSGTSQACTTFCGSTGNRICDSTLCIWGACAAPAENCSNGVDDDCNGLTDCNDGACANQPSCQQEVCDGVDNNANGQIDETFQCKLGAKTACTTTCGSTGEKTCQGPSCIWGACAPPTENCNNGIDDDCDGAPDCWDSDCLNATGCQHDFGTCQAFTPTNQPYTCGTWQQDVMPDGMYQVKDGCANSLNDQWVIGGTYGEGRVRHLTNGTTWQDVALPLTTKMAMGVTCQGATDTHVVAVESPNNGVLLRWNGTTFVRLAETQTKDVEFDAVWASSASNVWIYGRTDYGLLDGAFIYVWNGSNMSRRKLPQLYAPMTFHAAKMWGSGPNDVYLAGTTYDPNDRGNASKYHAGLMHYDGKSWGIVTVPSEVTGLIGISGSSSCDVMATGAKVVGTDSTGITLQRNGSSWTYKTYTNLTHVQSVAKVGAFKYVLQGGTTVPKEVWMGTDLGNFNVTWNRSISYLATGSDFWHGGASWNIPGANTMMTAGDGSHAAGDPSGYGEYAHVFRSTCQ